MITYSAPASFSIARADLAGERALALPVQVLAGDADVERVRRVGRGERREGRRDDDLDVVHVLRQLANSLMNATASRTVLYIFQFAAMNGVLHVSLSGARDARQLAPSEEFERRAAAGRNVCDAIGDSRLRDRGDRSPPPITVGPLHGGDRLRDLDRCPGRTRRSRTPPAGRFQTTGFADAITER
jgi:hypothetical protein